MSLDQQFDRNKLNHIDQQLRKLMDDTYDLCLYKCSEKYRAGMDTCKQNCYKTIWVPYKFTNHIAREGDENLYKKCLAEKFPNIQQKDYLECTSKIFVDRVEILSKFMGNTAEKVLRELH